MPKKGYQTRDTRWSSKQRRLETMLNEKVELQRNRATV